MNKKIWIPIIITALMLTLLLVPYHVHEYSDGTTFCRSLTYLVVDWHRWNFTGLKVYVFPDNFHTYDTLWQLECDRAKYRFTARVVECGENWVLVEPLDGEEERKSCDRISFGPMNLEDIGVQEGSVVEIIYNGEILETYPAQILPISWRIV